MSHNNKNQFLQVPLPHYSQYFVTLEPTQCSRIIRSSDYCQFMWFYCCMNYAFLVQLYKTLGFVVVLFLVSMFYVQFSHMPVTVLLYT